MNLSTQKIQNHKLILSDLITQLKNKPNSPRHQKIIALINKIFDPYNIQMCYLDNKFEFYNIHLSSEITLADLKISLLFNDKLSYLIIKFFKLNKNIELISSEFSFFDRLESVSKKVLRLVSLYDLQKTGLAISLYHSPVWYALVDENAFLTRQVRTMKNLSSTAIVVAARIRDIEQHKPLMLKNFESAPYKNNKIIGNLNLHIGKLRMLSGSELNNIGAKLPTSACAILSDFQFKSLKFKNFSGEKLDSMITGNGSDQAISHRLGNLNQKQLRVYLNKTSGCHFHQLPDSFFAILPLSKLRKQQINTLFSLKTAIETDRSKHRLQLVPEYEIANGLNLLSNNHLSLLSNTQLQHLHFSKLTAEQFSMLFNDTNLTNIERRHKIQLIPPHYVNDVISYDNTIVKFLSQVQLHALNVSLLSSNIIQRLFPSFVIQLMFQEYEDCNVFTNEEVYYTFENNTKGRKDKLIYSGSELEKSIQLRKNQCEFWAKKFTFEQIQMIIPMTNIDVRDFLTEFLQTNFTSA